MIFPQRIEQKIFDAERGYKLLFLPKDPSLFKIKPIVEEILSQGEKLNKEEIIQSLSSSYSKEMLHRVFDELEILQKRGFFCSKDNYPYRRGLESKDVLNRKPSIIELHLSHNCNLACTYCYAKGGDYGLNMPDKTMSWEVARKAIDWFLGLNINSQDRLTIHFFGGEPLLNVEVMKKTLEYVHRKTLLGNYPKVLFTITTNGTLLNNDRIVNLIIDYNIQITVSLNPIEEIHNKYCPYKDGRPSYKDIVKGIDRIRKISTEFPISITSVFGIEDDLKEAYEKAISLVVTSIGIGFEHRSYSSSPEEKAMSALEKIKTEWERQYQERLLRKRFPLEVVDYTQHLIFCRGGRRFAGSCGAGIILVAVLPNGEIHTCSGGQLTLTKSRPTYMGSVAEGISEESWERIYDLSINSPCVRDGSACFTCWARNYCSKSCPFITKEKPSIQEGENRRCDLFRARTEFYLKMFALMELEDIPRVIGRAVGTKDTAGTDDFRKKIIMLFNLRELRNQSLKYIRHVTPASVP